MKEGDVVKFHSFSIKFADFNGKYGVVKSKMDGDKFRVMVDSGKDRAVSKSNMDIVKIDLDEKLKSPYCLAWPQPSFKTHKLDNAKIFEILFCENPESIEISSKKVKVPGSSEEFALKTLIWLAVN